MIKLKIEKYRNFTEEENKAREEWQRRNNNYGMSNYNSLTPNGVEQYLINVLDVEITDEQFEALRKAVIEKF